MIPYIESLDEFQSSIKQTVSSKKLLIIDFTAEWCGPCQRISPLLEEMAREQHHLASFVKVDVDKAQNVAQHCGIRSMPTFYFYKGGELVRKLSGANPAALQKLVMELSSDLDGTPCCSDHDHDHCHGDELKDELKIVELCVPEFVVLKFFEESRIVLDQYRYERDDDDNNNDSSPLGPPSLDQLKAKIMSIQMEALENVVDSYEDSSKVDGESNHDVTVETLSEALRQIHLLSDDHHSDLKAAAEKFNCSARMALARAFLYAEREWRKDGNVSDRNLMNQENFKKADLRSGFVEFFGLCTNALKLPEIQKELEKAKAEAESDCISSENLIPPLTNDLKELRGLPAAQKKLISLQRICLGGVNFDHGFATAVLNKLPQNFPDDEELLLLFQGFINSMLTAVSNTISDSLHDEKTGTKVVSVKHSTVADTDAPSGANMDHQKVFEQKKELAMARKAAEMQQQVMGQLLELDEERRAIALKEAKEVHDEFITNAMKVPMGPERVAYLQSIDDDKQRKLIMHKLWEQLVAKNGGKPPKINYA